MTKVKICGLTRRGDVAFVNELLPEYVGFVFAESRRRISRALAEQLAATLDGRIAAVGVFRNQPLSEIAEIANGGAIRLIQLHGAEDADYIAELRRLTALPVIKSVRPGETVPHGADFALIDGENPGSGTLAKLGGAQLPSIPFFLAGGLTPENARALVRRYRPYCADVSSGVETDGAKDFGKMRAFIEAARAQPLRGNENCE